MASSENLASIANLVATVKTKSKSSKASIPQWTIHDDDSVLKETGYDMIKKIGHGSFAKVWKAKSFRLKKDVAIKIIAKPLASTEYVERFLPRELAIIQKLKHKNLIRFYEVIETWHSVYIVMDLAEKGTVADLIEKKKYIPEIQSRKYYIQLLDVVEYCHLNGIVHRDIKCENLLLDRDGTLLLTDFGFAKQDVYPLASGRFRPSKTYCGSYAYAPPEVLANKPYNPCLADVWCMGMVLYTMLFGILPYKHQNMKALIAAKKKPPHFPDSPFVSQRAKRFMLLMLVPESERAEITTLRKNQWLNLPKLPAMKRLPWLPGLKNSSFDEATTTVLNHCLPASSASLVLGNDIEDKSVTANLSGLLGNISSLDSSSSLDVTVLTSNLALKKTESSHYRDPSLYKIKK